MNLNDLFGLYIGNVYLILRLMTKISFRDKRYKKKSIKWSQEYGVLEVKVQLCVQANIICIVSKNSQLCF